MVATRYRVRPSILLSIREPWAALDFDLAIAARGLKDESEARKKAEKEAGKKGAGRKVRKLSSMRELVGYKG